MLTGLSSLLFGSGGADDAAVDQNQASRPTPLNTQDADNGWVLVDVAENENRAEADHLVREASQVQADQDYGVVLRAGHGDDDDDGEERENQLERRAGTGGRRDVQQRAARAARALELETQQDKVLRSVQRQQRTTRAKPLNRRHLDRANKALMSHSRQPASAHARVLRPSGQMNGRQGQRCQ